MDIQFSLLIFVILLALVFDFLNGFHDAANSISTIVSTRVLKPHWAVVWAAFFNFIAFLVFHTNVAATIGVGLIDPSIIDIKIIFSALIGAILWNLITWYYGLPSSSSHALIGGLVGAGITKAGIHVLVIGGIVKVVASIFLSPFIGFLLGLILMLVVMRLFFNVYRHKVDNLFKKLQFISAALFSVGHGGNDAQKTMGIIAVLLFSTGRLGSHFYVPLWVVIACNLVMALGTLFGGWRIVKTMGMKITQLKPVQGFCAETTAAATLFLANHLGIPVSTTHTITGAIVGVGVVRKKKAVRWGIARRIVWAWLLTLPAAGVVSGLIWQIINHF
jgi:PiT family inorganic phosphate transporter